MGIQLQTLIEATSTSLHDLGAVRVAIDGSNMLFQILNNPAQKDKGIEDKYYVDRTQRVITHLYGWIQKAIQFYAHKISAIVVFDGRPDPLKRETPQDSESFFHTLQDQYHTALTGGDREKAKKIALSKGYLWRNCVDESKRLLEACGISVVMAPTEAEAECVQLQKDGIVDYVVSSDYDVLCYGATQVIRQLTFATQVERNGKFVTTKPSLSLIDGPLNLNRLGINIFQLIDLSLILGNDYYPGISKIGPKTALETIKKFGSLEKIKKAHPHLFTDLSDAKIAAIREMFVFPCITKIASLPRLTIQPAIIQDLCTHDHFCNAEKINHLIDRLQQAATRYYKKYPWFSIASPIAPHSSDSPFVSALYLPDEIPSKLPKGKRSKYRSGKGMISKKVLNVESPAHPTPFVQIDNHFRIEVQMTEKEKTIYYIHKNTQFAEWPFDVQLQFRVIVDLLHGFGILSDANYHAQYEALWDQCPGMDSALDDLLQLSKYPPITKDRIGECSHD